MRNLEIRIEGAKTTIDRISSVYAVVNVSGISEDCSFVVEPVLYDSNGNKIDSTDITFSEDSLKVNVSLLDTKTVPVRWNIDVSPAEGYGIAEPAQARRSPHPGLYRSRLFRFF